MKDDDAPSPNSLPGVTRRDFMKISGIGVAVPLVLGPTVVRLPDKKSRSRPGQGADHAERQRQEAYRQT